MKKLRKAIAVALAITMCAFSPAAVNTVNAETIPLVTDDVKFNAGGIKSYNFTTSSVGKLYLTFYTNTITDLDVTLKDTKSGKTDSSTIKEAEWVAMDGEFEGWYGYQLTVPDLPAGSYNVGMSPAKQAEVLIAVTLDDEDFTPDPLEMSQNKLTITAGQSHKLSVTGAIGTVKWSSNKTSVATVKNGKITAKKPGKAVITAKDDSRTVKCTVTVKKNEYTDSSARVSLNKAPYGKIIAGVYKVSYGKKGTMVVKLRLYNNTGYKVTKFKKISLNVKTAGGAKIASYNTSKKLTMAPYTTKDITITIPKKNVKKQGADLRLAKISGQTLAYYNY